MNTVVPWEITLPIGFLPRHLSGTALKHADDVHALLRGQKLPSHKEQNVFLIPSQHFPFSDIF